MFDDSFEMEMRFLLARAKNLLHSIYRYHKDNKLFNPSSMTNEQIKLLMSYLTEVELLIEKIEEINIKVKKAQSTTQLDFDLILFTKLLKVKEKLVEAKNIEERFYNNIDLD